MKLIRYGLAGEEKTGIHIEGKNYDVSHIVKEYDESFFANNGLKSLAASIEDFKGRFEEIPEGVRLGCPVAGVAQGRPGQCHPGRCAVAGLQRYVGPV